MNIQLVKAITAFLVFIQGSAALSQSQCAEVFENQANAMEYMQVREMVSELPRSLKAIEQAKTLDAKNDGIYNLVVSANRVFDLAVELVKQVNYGKLPVDVQIQRSNIAKGMIEILQRTFEIGDNAMKSALTHRIELEVASQKELNEAAEVRRAIGFMRDQSSKEFHADSTGGLRQPVGFVRESLVGPEAPVKKQPIGFGHPKTVKQSIDQIVESMKIPLEIREAIEFKAKVEKLAKADAPEKVGPIGFVHSKPASQKITENGTHKYGFDVELGEFYFEKGQP